MPRLSNCGENENRDRKHELNARFGGDLVAAKTTRLSEAENARDKMRGGGRQSGLKACHRCLFALQAGLKSNHPHTTLSMSIDKHTPPADTANE
jgi:hypothetical protein